MEVDSPERIHAGIFQQILSDDILSTQNIILFLIIILFIICSALVSGSEIAFFSFKKDDLAEFERSKEKTERQIYELINQPRYLLATILITNNFFNIGIIITSFYLLNNVFDFTGFPGWIEIVVNTVLVTFLIVLFGEVIPKVYATQRARALAAFMARPLLIAKKSLYPFSRLLTKTTQQVESKMTKSEDEAISAEEMDIAIDLTTQGNTNKEEVQMLKSIVRFGDIAVKDVMTSRPDIEAVAENIQYNELVTAVRRSGFSRIPVYKDDLDNVTGVLYVKDLLAHLDEDERFEWNSLIREALFVPENKKIDDLLEDFQRNRMHIALVVDEYGGTTGLITLEDILEEIIGEIKDEFDDFTEGVTYKKISDRKYIFEGKVSLFDMCKIVGADFHLFEEAKGESDSLAGLILELSSKIPQRNQQIEYENYRFTVIDVDKKRIKKVDVEHLPQE